MQLPADRNKNKNKTKNFCKICNKPVKKKDAIQCQGMCQKWAHYKCLCYTPGKIVDLKSGVLKILCPCPDCGSEPKEVLDEKFMSECNKLQLPQKQCDCLQQNKASDSTKEDTYMWKKSRFPPYGAPYGLNSQNKGNNDPRQKSQAVRMQSWSLINIKDPKPLVHNTYQSNVNTPATPFKSLSSTSVQTSNNDGLNNSVSSSPCMLETLEQMCTTVTFLAEQILQIKNRLATINSTTTGSSE